MNTQPYTQKEQIAAHDAGHGMVPDWGQGLTDIRNGFRKLDDALPRSNQADAAVGYKQVKQALKDIHTFFKLRGVDLDA